MDLALLDNIFWHSLTGPLATFAVGGDSARRLVPGSSPMIGFRNLAEPDFGALEAHCAPGEALYCADWSGPMPPGWQLQAEAVMHRMVWDGDAAPGADDPELVPLRPDHADQAVSLAAATRPGPFGPRTIELGHYLGLFDGDRLVAMAGERLAAGPWREVSGICTHPDLQGRGLARRLTLALVRHVLAQGRRPFLHVMASNERARALYLRLGFRDHALVPVRVVARDGA